MKLLIIDDNPRMRRLIRSVVAGVAAQVFECGDGDEAPAAYARHRPDWVLMDIRMGSTDGITATRKILTDDPQARIVIVTDYDDAALREAAREAGACEYVVKENLLDLRRLFIDDRGSKQH